MNKYVVTYGALPLPHYPDNKVPQKFYPCSHKDLSGLLFIWMVDYTDYVVYILHV